MKQFKVTNIQFFDHSFTEQVSEFGLEEVKSYSANIIINDDFVVQLSGDENQCDVSIPTSNECFWNDEKKQDTAYDRFSISEIDKILDAEGIENNYYFLEENADEAY